MRRLRPWPGMYRPVWVAVEMTGRSHETFRTWAKNGRLDSRHDEKTGELLIHITQAVRLHETTPRRFRRLPGLADRAKQATEVIEEEPQRAAS